MQKYEVVEEFLMCLGTDGMQKKHYRIRATRDILEHGVKKGDFGGFVHSPDALSQEGNCWINSGVVLLDESLVEGDIILQGTENHSTIHGSSIGCFVSGNSKISGYGRIEDCEIENSKIHGVSLSLNDTKLTECKLTGRMIGHSSTLESCDIEQSEKGYILFKALSVQNKGFRLKIENVPGENLAIKNVEFLFSNNKSGSWKNIRCYGRIENFSSKELILLGWNGNIKIKNVHAENCAVHFISLKEKLLQIEGTLEHKVFIENESVNIVNSELYGEGIHLKGPVQIDHSKLLDYSTVHNECGGKFILLNTTLSDFSKAVKQYGKGIILENQSLKQEDVVII